MRPGNFLVMIGALNRPTMAAFSALYTLEPLYRAIILTVIPFMALEQFGSVRNVSIFFFVLGILGVGMSFSVPWLVSHFTRRGTFSLGAVTGILSMGLFIHGDVWSLALEWRFICSPRPASMFPSAST